MIFAALALTAVFEPQDDAARQARELTEKLRSDKIEEREDAARRLKILGKAAVPELEKAERGKDIEVSLRAKKILDDILCRTPEIALKKIELTIQEAKTLSVRFRIESTSLSNGIEQKTEEIGSILFGEGNKIWVDAKQRIQCRGSVSESQTIIASDGKRVRIKAHSLHDEEAPTALRANYSVLLARLGWWDSGWGHAALAEKYDIENEYRLSDLKFGEGGVEDKTLHYTVQSKRVPLTMKITVVYDLNTYIIRKRKNISKCTLKGQEDEGTRTETFEEFKVNENIPKEKFKLPEK
jgi:hypothetical protein